MNSFRVTIPNEIREEVLKALSEVKHVTLHTTNTSGKIIPPDGGGLEFEYVPELNSNQVIITIVKNPNNVPLEYLKGRLEGDIVNRFANYRNKF